MAAKRSFGFHMAVYAASSLGSRLIGFVMLPIYTRELTTTDYGIHELLAITTGVLGILLEGGIRSAVMRFYHRYEEPAQRRRVVSTAALFMNGLTAVGLPLLLLGSGGLADLILDVERGRHYFALVLVAFWFDLAAGVPLAYFTVEERSVLVVTLSVGRLLVQVALNVLLVVVHGMGLEGILWSSIVVAASTYAVASVLTFRRAGIGFDRSILGPMFRYSLPLVPASLSYVVLHFGDRYFLRECSGLAEVGIYALAYRFGMLISYLISDPFQRIWGTRGLRLLHEGDATSLSRILDRYALVLMWAWVGVSLWIGDVLRVMVGAEFHAAESLVPHVAFAYVLRSMADAFTLAHFFRYATRTVATVRIGSALVCLGLYALAIPAWGSLGAAWATIGSFGLMMVLMYALGRRHQRVPCDLPRMLRYFVLALAGIVALRSIPLEGPGRFVVLLAAVVGYPFAADWQGSLRVVGDACRLLAARLRNRSARRSWRGQRSDPATRRQTVS